MVHNVQSYSKQVKMNNRNRHTHLLPIAAARRCRCARSRSKESDRASFNDCCTAAGARRKEAVPQKLEDGCIACIACIAYSPALWAATWLDGVRRSRVPVASQCRHW